MCDVRLTKNLYMPKENIDYYTAYDRWKIKDEIRKLKNKDKAKVLDYTFGKKTLSVVYLKDERVVLLATNIDTLHRHLNLISET